MTPRTLIPALAVSLGLAGAAQAQEHEFRISHQLPPGHHIAGLVEAFAEDVEVRTDGRVEVEIFEANQAFAPDQNHPAVARGQVEGALSVNFQWGNTIPELNVVTIPYYFTDLERIERFPGSEAAGLIEDKLRERGVENVAWLFTTRQSIFTSADRPLVSLDDFDGVKIRGLNPLVDEGLIAAGAAPSAMPGSEVYQALQTGTIDAGLTDVSAAYSRNYYEVQDYGTVAPFFTVYFHLYVNPDWWEELPDDIREAIEAAAAQAEQDSIPITEETAKAAIGQLQDEGMEIHIQSDEEIEAFREVMQQPVMDAFLESTPDAAAIVEAVDKL